ncbi:glycoside hydrolase family 9 protein [Tolumonas lignilytica]|uniref:glycoside hydrolase family 9 protein n=1 Tax=Tolumonas lignilytica TaxID=1283284 RepID=UPI000462FDAF|nr:glycoside hydrolase family 9 protein [Tolumonas lignilytica]
MKIHRLSTLAVVMSCFIGLYGCAPESTNISAGASSGVSAGPSQELLNNGKFTQGTDGWWTAGATLAVDNQMGCATFANAGANPWDVILGQSGISLVKGQTYTLHFNAKAKKNVHIKALVQHDGAPYTSYIVQDITLNDTVKPFDIKFTPSASDEKTQLQFQMGTQAPTTVCVGDVSLVGPSFHKKSDLATVRVNQVGYLTKAEKRATIASDSKTPLVWHLLNAQGEIVAEGKTKPFGINEASGEFVHIADFSQDETPATGLVLEVAGQKSHPFNIGDDIYHTMKYDALSFFYQQRSGIDIEAKYVQRPNLARPAGHKPEKVTCFNAQDAKGNKWPGCDFSLDVTGGWYDAGDQGKYVVNGGISVWTLMNLYEHEQLAKSGDKNAFADGKVKIPEQGNQHNGLLNESRWMMDFFLAMQVPDGKKVSVPVGDQSKHLDNLQLTEIDASGMVFHKVADKAWTGMPLPPHKDPQPRFLSYPSTAATLNMAATAAQSARVWKDQDPAYAERCLKAAEKAWKAANRHPNVYAYDNFVGSGPYDDTDLKDEFYWAAAELFTTTGKAEYKKAIQNSPLYLVAPKGDKAGTGDLYWQGVGSAGTITLAMVPNKLDKKDVEKARAAIIAAADGYQQAVDKEGYLIPYQAKEYPWGSNSNLTNRSIFLGLAYDFTGKRKYLQAMADAMDYILGRNPMDQSYVSGYGFRPLKNPHHRFWAHSLDPASPLVPPGVISGGPNSINFSDPVAATLKGKCIGQTCWKDEIGAWTLNEVTVNWNAPFLWTTSVLDEGGLTH